MLARAVLVFLAAVVAHSPQAPAKASIAANDNRRPAGRLRDGVLTIRLEAREGVWHPDGAAGPALETAAFAEEGKELQTPGPLIRVPVGTEVRATITNSLDKPMWFHGMGALRGMSDSAQIAPHAARDFSFKATEPGSYYYAAQTGKNSVLARADEDSQLGGVILVDPPNTRADINERILAITSWFTIDSNTKSGLGPNSAVAFNGGTWPNSERLTFNQGDTVRFRIVNMSLLDHPLHLHGFYFTVDSKGDGSRDTIYTADRRHSAVTEYVPAMTTMSMHWVAARPGNWIFHCHFASHMTPPAAFENDRSDMTPRMQHSPSMLNHMSGLVLGMTVKPVGVQAPPGEVARTMRIVVRSKAKVYGDNVGYSFVLGGSSDEANAAAMPVPGPLLELTKGERVAINIVNRSHDQAAIHWHGIELESLPDGVPGWSGAGKNVIPMIAPGDSLTVRFTPTRAGTFMYHSHSNEMQQISSGLYGAIIVSEPGEHRDVEHDRVLLLSDAGPVINFFDITVPHALLNGELAPQPIDLPSDKPVRLRLINIRTEYAMDVALLDGGAPSQWRLVAKDGMPTPASQSGARPSTQRIAPGEIYDFEIAPNAGAALALRYAIDGGGPSDPILTVPVRVH